MKINFVIAVLIALFFNLCAVTVSPANAVIVVDKKADGVIQFAGKELQKYLQMITGQKIPIVRKIPKGKYPFIFGTPAGVKLRPEEARWEVTEKAARLYGDSTYSNSPRIMLGKVLSPAAKSGDLTAVYDFLEKQLGMLFLAPRKEGISYTPCKTLKLKQGKNAWVPRLPYRYLWPDYTNVGSRRYKDKNFPANSPKVVVPLEFIPATEKEYHRKKYESWLWLKQQRIGRSMDCNYFGHAFTAWWGRFGKTHPEYFALINGKRGPKYASRPKWSKLCVSNPAVWKQIVDDWAKNPRRGKVVNVCENDGGGFCECANCRKLDMPPAPGKKWDADLSDRYVYFGKQVLKEAKKIDPEAAVCQYAYSVYRMPPKREKIHPDTYIIYVPTMLQHDSAEKTYQTWKKMGARRFLVRPNDLHLNTSLPMGFQKSFYDAYQLAVKYGAFGTRYDSLHGFWDISGITDYILARCNVDPSKSFDYWMNEYCSAYGAAAPEVRKYFDYFQKNIWEKRLWPQRVDIARRERYGNFRKAVMLSIHEFFQESDFDNVEKFLRAGLKKKLNPLQRRRLETLLLVNHHSRLTCRAMTRKGKEKIFASVKLLKFRRENKKRLNINWEKLFQIEIANGDAAGVRTAMILADYSDFETTPVNWRFEPDPKNIGVKEKWYSPRHSRFRNKWRTIRTDMPWENQKYRDPAFKKLMADYNGFGFYSQNVYVKPEWKGKKVYLVFGAVDESAWVYVNGKYAGKRIYQKDPDYFTPFAIEITDTIDWSRRRQNVAVRVQDSYGAGGIWKPVYLAVSDK